jgi:hypothetical protein
MKKIIFLLICTFLATSVVFAQERQRRGGKQQEDTPPVTQQPPERMTTLPSEKKLDPRIEKSLSEMKIPENFEVIYTSQSFKFQKLNSESKWKIKGTITQVPEDAFYGSYFDLIIYLPFNTQREFHYDGKEVKMTDSDNLGGDISGSATDSAVMKKFQDKFKLLSYHLTGDFFLNPSRVLAHMKRVHAEADYINSADQNILGIIFRLPPSPGNEPQELHLTLDESLILKRLDRIYFLREERFQDIWEFQGE